MQHKKGFTLIEIIVVLIIVGVLAAIALPALFSWIERSRAAEVVPELKHIADQLDLCYAKNGDYDYASCAANGSLNHNAVGATTHFFLSWERFNLGGPVGYKIKASRNNVDNASGLINVPYTIIWSNPAIPDSGSITNNGGTVFLCYDPVWNKRWVTGSGFYLGEF